MSLDRLKESRCGGSFSFLLPAEWDFVPRRKLKAYTNDRYSISLDRRLDMVSAVKMLLGGKWEPFERVRDITENNWSGDDGFEPGPEADRTHLWLYNEFVYYTDKVRPLIYNGCEYVKGDTEGYLRRLRKTQPPVVILKRKAEDDRHKDLDSYVLLRETDTGFLLYSLPLTGVQLRLYASGVMTLSICCNDELNAGATEIRKHSVARGGDIRPRLRERSLPVTAGDIAWIRNAGRRLFWPFGCHRGAHCPRNEAPMYSALLLGSEEITICDYRSLAGWDRESCGAVTKPEYFEWSRALICPGCVSQMKLRSGGDMGHDGDLLVMSCFNDDRMYLHNTVVSDTYACLAREAWINRKRLDSPDLSTSAKARYWEGLRAWYAIIAMDSDWHDATCQDVDMVVQKCEAATDARWVENGTLYGLCCNSMTQLIVGGGSFDEVLSQNMDWMYYQMFLLGIMQRSSLQRFYREASGGTLARSRRQASRLASALKEKYVFFMNRMWFTRVTEQVQGCDFFERLQKNMGLSEDMALLKDAIEELNALAGRNLEEAVSHALLPATWIELGFVVFTGLAIISTEEFGKGWRNNLEQPTLWLMAAAGVVVALGMTLLYLLKQDRGSKGGRGRRNGNERGK